MEIMFFPSRYKKALTEKKKNITVRYGKEFNKYKRGKIYHVKSYAGRNWNIKVKVSDIFRSDIEGLRRHGISSTTIRKLRKEHKGIVEVIRFGVI